MVDLPALRITLNEFEHEFQMHILTEDLPSTLSATALSEMAFSGQNLQAASKTSTKSCKPSPTGSMAASASTCLFTCERL